MDHIDFRNTRVTESLDAEFMGQVNYESSCMLVEENKGNA
jgi:hypothetical protein